MPTEKLRDLPKEIKELMGSQRLPFPKPCMSKVSQRLGGITHPEDVIPNEMLQGPWNVPEERRQDLPFFSFHHYYDRIA